MKLGKSKLAMRFILGIAVLGSLICLVSGSIGYRQYKRNFQKRYNQVAYNIAGQAHSYLKPSQVNKYVALIQKKIRGENVDAEIQEALQSEDYWKVRQNFVELRENMYVNDIFLVYVDRASLLKQQELGENWKPLYYLYDSYEQEELSYSLGDSGPFNPKYVEDVKQMLQTGKRCDNYFISEGQYGYNTSAMLPISMGQNILFLVVEMPMSSLQDALNQYVLSAVSSTAAIVVVMICIYSIYLLKKVIDPINSIAREAGAFIENGVCESASLSRIHTRDEIENLAQGVLKMQNDIGSYIENLTSITAEKERIGAELNVANQIQASMLPCIFPAFPERKEFDIFASMDPAKEVGGDFYDFFLVDDDHLVMVVADVSGKGVPAALFMMISKTLLKSAAHQRLSPKEILERVNNQLCENNDAEMFVTAWLGKLCLSTGDMVCANAGHEYPAIYRKNEGFDLYKDRHGFVLAGMPNMHYREYEIHLDPGDMLYMYTDGVTEATDIHKELYGTDRMIEALNVCPSRKPQEVAAYVRKDIDAFVGEAEQFDDITMLCMRYNRETDEEILIVDASVSELNQVTEFLEQRLEEKSCPMKAINQIVLSVEEMFVNIASYAYPEGKGQATFKLRFAKEPPMVILRIEDQGIPYDPLQKPDPDITLTAEQRAVGGLGIFMTKKLMDEVSYTRENDSNILTLSKKI